MIGIALLLMALSAINIDIKKEIVKEDVIEKHLEIDDKAEIVINKNKIVDNSKNKVIISPSMDFMQNIENQDYYNNKKVKVIAPRKQKDSRDVVIKRKDDNEDIQNLIKRFNKNSDPSISLFIAKKYYKFGKYDKSYKYALITNNIDSEVEDSWLIFIKSLVKLDRKKRATDILVKYIKHSDSSRAKRLLDDINKGRIK